MMVVVVVMVMVMMLMMMMMMMMTMTMMMMPMMITMTTTTLMPTRLPTVLIRINLPERLPQARELDGAALDELVPELFNRLRFFV